MSEQVHKRIMRSVGVFIVAALVAVGIFIVFWNASGSPTAMMNAPISEELPDCYEGKTDAAVFRPWVVQRLGKFWVCDVETVHPAPQQTTFRGSVQCRKMRRCEGDRHD